MLERLIEYWLDSASERSYQEPFCQMLIGMGHKVIHSTRHAAIELGKDIISIDENGEPCAFQLKGNPGSRLTLTQFREIEIQLFEMAAQPIEFPGLKTANKHRSYLVTNGQVDEEVQLAVRNLNKRLKTLGLPHNAIQIWTRGELLKMANKLGASLWPSEVPDLGLLLEFLTHKGEDDIAFESLHKLLQSTLRLDKPHAPKMEEFKRRATSAALLAEICLHQYRLAKNYHAIIKGLVMLVSYLIAASSRSGFSDKHIRPSINVATTGIRDALTDMCAELVENPNIGSRRGMDFSEVYGGRLLLISAYMSIHWLWSEDAGWKVKSQREFLQDWLPKLEDLPVWGEAAIPELLAVYWMQNSVSTGWAEQLALEKIAETVVFSLRNPEVGLASPYFSFSDVMRHKYRDILKSDDPLRGEAMSGVSHTSEALLHLLVRANLKTKCKMLWGSFNKLAQERFDPKHSWEYCLWRTEEGNNLSTLLDHTQKWDDLVEIARDCRVDGVPRELLQNKFFLALFLMTFPHRISSQVVRYLDQQLGGVWFISKPPILN